MKESLERIDWNAQKDDSNNKESISSALAEGNQEKIEAALKRLTSIAQTVGGDYDMKVGIGKPGGGSYFNTQECSITLDPVHLLEDEETSDFITGHEGSHRAITRIGTEFGYTEDQINKMYSQTGFQFMHNSVEDPAVNDFMQKKVLGLRKLTKGFYDKQFKTEEAVLTNPEVNKIAAKIGYMPKFAQFGSEIIRRWHQNRYSKELDPEVAKALKKTEFFSDKSVKAIPSPEIRDEGEILTAAKKRFELNNDYVWPEMKKLVDMDIKNEAGKEALDDLLKKDKEREDKKSEMEKTENSDRKEELKKDIDKLDEELKQLDEAKQEMEQAIKDMTKRMEQAQQQGNGAGNKEEGKTGEEKESKESGEQTKNQDKPDQLNEYNKKEEGKQEKKSGQEKADQKSKEQSSKTDEQPAPLTPEEQELLQKVYDSLPREAKQKYEQAAKEKLDKLEDALNEELSGKLLKELPKNHEEQKQETTSRSMKSAGKTREIEQEHRIKEKLDRERRENITHYERIREKSKPLADYLYRTLMRSLHPEELGGEETELVAGEKIDMARVIQSQADFRQKLKLWTREIDPERRDYRFQFCMDISGSTSDILEDEKIGLFSVADALNRLEQHNTDKINIKHSISTFSDDYNLYKSYKDKLTMPLKEDIAGIGTENNTNTLLAVKHELDLAFTEGGTTGTFVLIFSDGEPNSDVRKPLMKLLADTKKKRETEKVHVGLMWVGDNSKSPEILAKECEALIKNYNFDFGLPMNVFADKDGQGYFGKQLTAAVKNMVDKTV